MNIMAKWDTSRDPEYYLLGSAKVFVLRGGYVASDDASSPSGVVARYMTANIDPLAWRSFVR